MQKQIQDFSGLVSGVEAGSFLRSIPRRNKRVWKIPFMWMREGKENVTTVYSHEPP